jgi:TolA-binding protein
MYTNVKVVRLVFTILFIAGIWISCAYFNTFYNAQDNFRQGMKLVTHDTLKFDNDSFDKAIEKSTAVIVKYPNSRYIDDALFIMGASYYYKGDYSRALEKLSFLQLNYPESKHYDDALYYQGLAYYKQRKIAQAIIALEEAKTFDRFTTKAMLALGYVYFYDNNYSALTETAEGLLNRGLSTQNRRWVLSLLAEAQRNQLQYSSACETYLELLEIAKTDNEKRELKLKVAETYLDMGEYESCKSFLKGEYDPEFRTILADLNVELGKIAEAKDLYLEIGLSDFSPLTAQAFYKLAELYRAEDSVELAIAFYDSSVDRDAQSEYGKKSKAMAGVLRRIDTLASETEETDRAQFLLAEIYFVDLGEPEHALVEYQKVYSEFPESMWAPKALYAELWIEGNILKNDSTAQRLLRDLLMKYPDSEYARSAQNIFGERYGVSTGDEEPNE